MVTPLQEWRKSKQVTQRQIAMLIGVSSGHWSEVENGIVPMDDKIAALLKAAGAEHVIASQKEFLENQKNQLMETLKETPANNGKQRKCRFNGNVAADAGCQEVRPASGKDGRAICSCPKRRD